MKILFIGDIVGSTGRAAVKELLPSLKSDYGIDLTIANGENAAHGKGITRKIYDELLRTGIDLITLGNHAFSKSDIYGFIDQAKQLVRPANLDPTDVGTGIVTVEVKGQKVSVVNLCGSVFMEGIVESPFVSMKKIAEISRGNITIVDLHAEATSEKIAFTYMFQDCCTAVLGTHTHVQTADEKIMNGCAYISDVGMCGPYDGVIGREVKEVLDRFNGRKTTVYTVAQGDAQFCAVVLTINEETKRAESIERIQIRPAQQHISKY